MTFGRIAGPLVLALLATLPFLPGAAVAETVREQEPAPPWIFFPDPDDLTAQEIKDLVENSFADLSRVVRAREFLVRRYGLWSVQELVSVLLAESAESRTWNAALTAYALRDELGNARQLWRFLYPLRKLAEDSAEPYRRAFSCLAIGSFHSLSFIPEPLPVGDRLVRRVPEREAKSELTEALDAVGHNVTHSHNHVQVAAALALAKGGDPTSRDRLLVKKRLALSPEDRYATQLEARMATLVALGFLPRDGDDRLLIRWLGQDNGAMRRAAAVTAWLQALADPAPDWVQSPARVLQALKSPGIRLHLEDGAEAVFARGVFAARTGSRDEWRALFDLAIRPSTKSATKRAASQGLLFCEDPFFLEAVKAYLVSSNVKDPVLLAMFFQRLAETGTREALELCGPHLRNAGRIPKAKRDWDIRFHSVIGLLRALSLGRVTDPELRRDIATALQHAVDRGLDKDSPFRAALVTILEHEGRFIREQPGHRVPEKRIQALEASFRDVHGLLARDLIDVAVVRLNDLMPVLFNVNNLPPGKPGEREKSEIPRRFLRACYDVYPYFSRLDLRADRGRRSPPRMVRGEDASREVLPR